MIYPSVIVLQKKVAIRVKQVDYMEVHETVNETELRVHFRNTTIKRIPFTSSEHAYRTLEDIVKAMEFFEGIRH